MRSLWPRLVLLGYCTLIFHSTLSAAQTSSSESTSLAQVDSSNEVVIAEREKRLHLEISQLEEKAGIAERYLARLKIGTSLIADDSSEWKKLKETIQYALEDESFVPGSQNFRSIRANVRDRIYISNARVKQARTFLDYYASDQFQWRPLRESKELTLRDSDPKQFTLLFTQINESQNNLAKQLDQIQKAESDLIRQSLSWETQYRKELFQTRGSLINEVIQGNAFALNNFDPINLEFNSLLANIRFYFWRGNIEDIAKLTSKRLLTFSSVQHIFKLFIIGLLVFWLYKKRKNILQKCSQWVRNNLRTSPITPYVLGLIELIKELYLFLILLIAGELIISVMLRMGFSFAGLFTPILHYIIIYLLLSGFINFLSPKLSQRERRQSRNAQEVSAMETVFEFLPKLYLKYWALTNILTSLINETLHKSLINFYISKIIAISFILALYVSIRLDRERWRTINEKATHSDLWQKVTSHAVGKFWEPLVLLIGGGLGVYRVAWLFLMEQIAEMEMTKRFQAMISRAILERHHRKSTLMIQKSWFPEAYWNAFNYLTPASSNWYVAREAAEEILSSSYKEWEAQHTGQRILLCGDRGREDRTYFSFY